MNQFKPTFLYIKQHKITGLLYFGKTTKNPEKYHGSGVYWLRHLKIHGTQHVENLWYCLFLDEQDCKNFATAFSLQNKIVDSDLWANFIIEDGMSPTNCIGRKMSAESRAKISKANSGKTFSDEINKRKGSPGEKNPMYGISRCGEKSPHFGKPHSEITKQILSEKAKAREKIQCPHCSRLLDKANAYKWHFSRCKLLVDQEP